MFAVAVDIGGLTGTGTSSCLTGGGGGMDAAAADVGIGLVSIRTSLPSLASLVCLVVNALSSTILDLSSTTASIGVSFPDIPGDEGCEDLREFA